MTAVMLPVHREVVRGAITLVIAEMKTVAPGDDGYRYMVDKPMASKAMLRVVKAKDDGLLTL